LPPGLALGKGSEAEKGLNFDDDKRRGKIGGNGVKDRIAGGQKRLREKAIKIIRDTFYSFLTLLNVKESVI